MTTTYKLNAFQISSKIKSSQEIITEMETLNNRNELTKEKLAEMLATLETVKKEEILGLSKTNWQVLKEVLDSNDKFKQSFNGELSVSNPIEFSVNQQDLEEVSVLYPNWYFSLTVIDEKLSNTYRIYAHRGKSEKVDVVLTFPKSTL